MAAPRPSRRPVHLVLDWDSTLTMKDTMSLLGNVHKVRDPAPSAQRPAWDTFFSAYMDDYKAHKAAHYPTSPIVSHEVYRHWLQSLDAVELASSRRVSESEFFRGTKSEHIQSVASQALLSGELQLCPGWEDMFSLFLPRKGILPPSSSISILSVNFSATFIRSALQSAVTSSTATPYPDRDQLATLINGMIIQANEIEGLDLSEGSSGQLCSSIRTAEHKLARMTRFRQEHQGEQPIVVYVGDSATDYECLRAADIGIWICDCAQSEYLERFAQTFKPLGLGEFKPIAIPAGDKCVPGKTCLWTSSLAHVVELLKGLDSHTVT